MGLVERPPPPQRTDPTVTTWPSPFANRDNAIAGDADIHVMRKCVIACLYRRSASNGEVVGRQSHWQKRTCLSTRISWGFVPFVEFCRRRLAKSNASSYTTYTSIKANFRS